MSFSFADPPAQPLIAGQGHHPLGDQGPETVLDPPGIAVIDEAGSKVPGDVEHPVGLPQKHGTAVRGHQPAVETSDHPAPTETFKFQFG